MARFINRIAHLLAISFLLTSCGGHKQAKVKIPPPPPIAESQPQIASESSKSNPQLRTETLPTKTEPAETEEALRIPASTKPIVVETGLASWYGAPYHNRRGSNGKLYDMHAMTAAHRTLPLGSIVRVTNEKTGHAAIVRITDRGPFIRGRILDLSEAAAKKVDVWAAGVATVRLEVLRTPVPLDSGGRWAVQIGGFDHEDAADELANRLSRRYRSAKVLCFSSPVGAWWVRVRVQDDDRERAEAIARNTGASEAKVFLVRLD